MKDYRFVLGTILMLITGCDNDTNNDYASTEGDFEEIALENDLQSNNSDASNVYTVEYFLDSLSEYEGEENSVSAIEAVLNEHFSDYMTFQFNSDINTFVFELNDEGFNKIMDEMSSQNYSWWNAEVRKFTSLSHALLELNNEESTFFHVTDRFDNSKTMLEVGNASVLFDFREE